MPNTTYYHPGWYWARVPNRNKHNSDCVLRFKTFFLLQKAIHINNSNIIDDKAVQVLTYPSPYVSKKRCGRV